MNKKAKTKKGRHSQESLLGISLLYVVHQIRKRLPCFTKTGKAGDPRLQHSGMTPLFNGAFTLIELLVVVLIIGILSAIALPQYTIAVEKSRAAEALLNARTLKNAIELEILATGTCNGLENLDISIGTTDADHFYTKYFEYENVCFTTNNQADYSLMAAGRGLRIEYTRSEDKWICSSFDSNDGAYNPVAYKVCNSICKSGSKQSQPGDSCEL